MKKIPIVLLILLIISGGCYYYIATKPSNEVISFSDDLYLIVEDQIIEHGEPVVEIDNMFYFSYNFLKEYIDSNLFYDELEKTVIFTNEDYVKRFTIDEMKGSVNSKEIFINNPVVEVDDSLYIPLNLFSEDYEINVVYYDETNAVVLDFTNMEYLEGEVIIENPIIRSDLDKKAPIIENNLILGDLVYVYGEYESWLKIRTKDGLPGFIEKEYIKLNHTKDIYKNELKEKVFSEPTKSKKINLTWDYTYSKVKYTDKIKHIPGVNVISPTWFSIIDENGTIIDKGNHEYVKKYRNMGYDLWALVDNNFNPDVTHELLKSTHMREKLINDLLKIYINYGFQGINLDFENVYLKDKDLMTQFVRELYPLFKENGIIVSMDITTISTSENWSLFYDRKRLHQALDYVVLMAYDQHWASSPIAGSVAEYGWVENGLFNVLEEIPSEKLILGVPFYTRLWTVEGSKTSSKSLSMDVANNFISINQIETVWKEDIGQHYGEIIMDNKEYRIWLEDEKSLEYKISLVHKYNLAGIASWRKGFETDNIWESIEKALY